jgi:hypothetical protein
MERIPASERTRENLKALMTGRSEIADGRSELVRLAARLIIEEALEGEARDALGRDSYARGAAPGAGYRRYHVAPGEVGRPARRQSWVRARVSAPVAQQLPFLSLSS